MKLAEMILDILVSVALAVVAGIAVINPLLNAFGFLVIVSLFTIGFVLDAFSQLHFSHKYEMPVYLIEFCRLTLQSALGAGAFVALREARKKHAEKKNDLCLPPGESTDDTSRPGRRIKAENLKDDPENR